MRVKIQALLFVISLLLTSSTIEARPINEHKKGNTTQEARKKLEKNALDLLDKTLTEAESLKLPENRAWVIANVADILWTRDEKRARLLFIESASNIMQMMSGDPNDPEFEDYYGRLADLRADILKMAGRHDQHLAHELLSATHMPRTGLKKDEPDPDSELADELDGKTNSKENELTFIDADGKKQPFTEEVGKQIQIQFSQMKFVLSKGRGMTAIFTMDSPAKKDDSADAKTTSLPPDTPEDKGSEKKVSEPAPKSRPDRAGLLIEQAVKAIDKGDKKSAGKFLDEAHSLMGYNVQNISQLKTQLELAKIYGQINSSQGLDILGYVIPQLNSILNAASVLDPYEEAERAFVDEEMLTFGDNKYVELINKCSEALNSIVNTDFEAVRTTADAFSRNDAKVMAQLAIAQSVLTVKSSKSKTDK